nr:hypothetical protein [Tanacetum cinerariifolium]
PGPEEPEQAPPSPVYIPYVPDPVYPEYIPPEDDVFPAGESSFAAAARPIEGRRADYGFVDSVEAEIRRRRAEDIGYGVNTRVIELAAVQEQDNQDIYGVMEDTQATLTTQLSSLQGHLATALGEIRALQAREQARAGAPKGAGSST